MTSAHPSIPNPDSDPSSRNTMLSRPGLHTGLIFLFTFLTYINTLYNTFHLDDFPHIMNPGIETVSPMSRHFVDPSTMSILPGIRMYRPLLPLTFSWNYALHGHDLPGYHLFNMTLHALTAMFVYFLCFELLRFAPKLENRIRERRYIAWVVALVFVVHPVSGIPINYISGRDLILMYLFLTASFYFYIRMEEKGSSLLRWAGVLLLYLLSLLSKQNALVMPALIFIYEWLLNKNPAFSKQVIGRALPFALVAVGLQMYVRWGLSFSEMGQVMANNQLTNFWAYPLTQLKLHLFRYGFNFFWPWGIREAPKVIPSDFSDPLAWIGLAFILGTLVLAWKYRHRNPLITFCILSYWIIFAPSSSVVPLMQLEFDYRAYPSSVFLYLILALVTFHLVRAGVFAFVSVMVLVYLSMAANHFNHVWKTGESLWGHSIAGNGSALAHHNYATSSKDLDVRVTHFRKSVELAPWYPLARINLGLALMSQGKKEEGLKHVEKGWEMGPQPGQNSFLTAMGYKMAGKTKKAAALAAMSAHAIPINRYQYEAAFLLIKSDQPALAIPFLEALRKKNPDFEFSGYLLALAYERTERTEEAIATYEYYIPRHPQDFFAKLNLAKLDIQQGNCARAVEGLQQALALNVELPEAHKHLATCHEKLGNPAEAKKHLAIWKQSQRAKK